MTQIAPITFATRFRGFLPVVIDVETGGFNSQTDALLEIAAVFLEMRSDGTLAELLWRPSGGAKIPFSEAVLADRSTYVRMAGREVFKHAVGMITEAKQAQKILDDGDADVVIMARELLRDPYFPRRAAKELGATITPPLQYSRAW